MFGIAATLYPHGPATGGWIIGLIAFIIAITLCIVVFTYATITTANKKKNEYKREDALVVAIGALIATLGVISAFVWLSWPFAYEYHHWVPTTGTVESVSSRIVSDGDKGVNQKFVIRFTDGRVRALNDSIASVLKPGDVAQLRCKKAYDYGVPRDTQGWDCKWAGPRS